MALSSLAAARGGLLKGKVSIITGASSGLGRAIALSFVEQGSVVVCADRAPAPRDHEYPPTHEVIRSKGGRAIFQATNVSHEPSVKDLVQRAVDEFGRVDIMVNNAGIAPEASEPHPIWETPLEVFDSTWKVNIRGVFLGCKYAGKQMMRQERLPNDLRAGTIINMASVLGVLGKPGTSAYAASKGAVIALTRTVAMDYAPHHIHCNSILPGFTRTAMISAMTGNSDIERHLSRGHPLQRLGEPEEIAGAALFLTSSLSDGITGLNMSVDGGLHAQLNIQACI